MQASPLGSVLVADDNSVNRIMLARYLEKLGDRTMLAEDSQQALRQLLTCSFEPLLLDVQMPEQEGRKRRKEMAQLLKALVEKHATGTIYVAWDNADTHADDEVEAVVRAAAGRLVLLDLPTYSPWLNPIEMLWRHFRREVTPCELFETKQALLLAAQECFDRFNQCPEKILSVIGSNAQKVS